MIFLGDVFYLNAAGQPIVVLNTQKTAADLLDRRAAIYSDRPRNIVAAQILCGGLAITFQNYGPLCADFLLLSAVPDDSIDGVECEKLSMKASASLLPRPLRTHNSMKPFCSPLDSLLNPRCGTITSAERQRLPSCLSRMTPHR